MNSMLVSDNGNKADDFPLIFPEIIQGLPHIGIVFGPEVNPRHLIFPFAHPENPFRLISFG
jgi:hypothetical protein